MDKQEIIEFFKELKLHQYDIIELWTCERIVCNDECEVCYWNDKNIKIHPNEDEEYGYTDITGIWKYDEETDEYKKIF